MLSNAQIAATLDQLADLAGIPGGQCVSHSRLSQRLAGHPQSVAVGGPTGGRGPGRMLTDRRNRQVGGREVHGSGADRLVAAAGIAVGGDSRKGAGLLRIPGLGPKKAARAVPANWESPRSTQLKQACEAQQVRALKGFGAKTEAGDSERHARGRSRWRADLLGGGRQDRGTACGNTSAAVRRSSDWSLPAAIDAARRRSATWMSWLSRPTLGR